MRWPSVAGAATLVVASLVLSLGAAELALRRIEPAWVVPYPPRCYRPDLFERWEPAGYRLHPGRTVRDRYPFWTGRHYTITADPNGFRSRRDVRAPDDGRVRVVVLGDSMMFGPGVEEPERVSELIEGAGRGGRWRVDNFGMIGFGPDLMLRALETVGLDPPPRAVVIALFSHDLYRVVPEAVGVGFPLPRYVLRDGALTTVPYPERPEWMRLFLVQGVRYGYFRYTPATFVLNAAVLDRFAALGRERAFALGVVFVPGPRDGRDDRMRRRWLAGWAAGALVPFLDLTEPIAAHGGERIYIPDDSHWSVEGHRIAAELLKPFVAGLIEP